MAIIVNPNQMDGNLVSGDGASGLIYKTLFAPGEERRLSANLVTVEPHGITRKHQHQWEQINFIVRGSGVVVDASGERHAIASGMAVHFPANELHWFENNGTEDMIILGVLGPDAKG